MYICLFVYVYMRICLCVYTYSVCVYVCMYVCMYVCIRSVQGALRLERGQIWQLLRCVSPDKSCADRFSCLQDSPLKGNEFEYILRP